MINQKLLKNLEDEDEDEDEDFQNSEREYLKKKNESSDFNILAILGIIFGLIITTFGGIFAWYRYGHKGDLPSWIPTFLTKLLRPSGVVVPTATATAMPTAIYQQ